jgi:pimeloyl-ACP methyl ester carboxylesterase
MAGTVETVPTVIAGETVHLAQEGRIVSVTEVNLAKWREWWRYVRTSFWYLWVAGSLVGVALPVLLAAQLLPAGTALGAFEAPMAGSLGADWDVPYERLAVPVWVVVGLHDRVFHVPADVEELAARIPHRRVVTLPDAGHLVPVERPAAFTRLLLDVARELDARPRTG